jgi:hypothetical protein
MRREGLGELPWDKRYLYRKGKSAGRALESRARGLIDQSATRILAAGLILSAT